MHDPFPSLSPFYHPYEDERRDEPEFIVDPLTGFVVGIVPPVDRSVVPRRRRLVDGRSRWRATLDAWLRRLR
ncbi:MAG TPA: hypothetical protein VNV38_04605 [Stellaceae bacterium]|jgi:hypothetical protein|nr:hypothetical protein [Stellaceae bacterium]